MFNRNTVIIPVTIISVFLFPDSVRSQFSYNTNAFSFCYGSTYRFDESYRHSFSIDFWNLNGGCIASEYSGAGVSLEWTNKSCYNIGMRYFRSPARHPAFFGVIGYLGVEPNLYFLDGDRGLNIAPEIGMHVPLLFESVGGGFSLFYGYDIPVVRASDYQLNRNRITLKLSLEIAAWRLDVRNWFRHERRVDAVF